MPHAPMAPDWDGTSFEDSHHDVPEFDGETYEPERDHERLAKQTEAVRSFMSDHLFHTLDEISLNIDAPEASVSARLRDLRKERFGGHVIERRYRGGGLWEYAMDPSNVAPVVLPPVIHTFMCTGCNVTKREDELSSKYGKPQVVGFIREKRLMEARCYTCDKKPHKGLQAIWREQ